MVEWILKYNDRFLTKNFNALIVVIFILFNPNSSELYAQLTIISPVNNQILQRDTAGFANIAITGYTYFPYARIEAQLTPLKGNIHQSKELLFTQDQINQGFLSASIQAETGWYKLKLTGYGNGGMIDSAIVPRVGIGEVFLVAGNSNAMGLPDLGAKDASDQVISYNAINKILNPENITVAPDEPMQVPEFSPVQAKNYIFPSGETSWYWAELGDKIHQKMNTPVLFLNAAWAAANSENYRDAASGKDALNIYVNKKWPNRQPYTNLINTLRYFNSWLGIRAVLWSHGENDAQLGFTEQSYFNNIKILIENSRTDTGHKVPWIIAKNSTSPTIDKPYLPVTNAQNRLSVIKDFNTFIGPDLDTIQIPRPAHGHFENISGGIQGLTLAANAWNRILSDSLFGKIIPLQPKYAIHTGVVPSKFFPGAAFTLPFNITGLGNDLVTIQAELLDQAGKFVAIAGIGNESPAKITLPVNLTNGEYKLRLTATKPILAGSVSESFYVNNNYKKIDFINTISARLIGENIYISWLVAANPQLKSLVLQKMTDGKSYVDLKSFEVLDNEIQSHLYAYSDPNSNEGSIYYRIKSEYKNGETAFSTVVTVFQEGAPPQFTVFPNPVTNQQFYLRPDKPETNFQCSLFDVKGREHQLIVNDREVIGLLSLRPLYNLSAGNYILRIVTDSGISTQLIMFL